VKKVPDFNRLGLENNPGREKWEIEHPRCKALIRRVTHSN
jgi:hypothetical protein